ncbi:MAG TPA: saccharopine dehydrogenase C-terminal domain-containing protein [Longimicrobiales bacterium]|nr:saccharopine dehydrogenase C-terminal domain-containing protein [Longimicrobiales bacterium]
MRIVVLGAGRVGGAIVRDLSSDPDHAITVVDLDPQAMERLEGLDVDTELADLSNAGSVAAAVEDADLVVGCVPGFMGYRTVEAVLEAGKPVVDISFFPEDAFQLDELAREQGVPCLVDCGVAPGLTNMILGRMEQVLDETTSFKVLMGGLPVERGWPWEYKAPFSPRDVIQEYTRPARLRRNGEDITLPALSEIELVHFPGLGTLEAFNTDGLRSLIETSQTPNMVEKTMRYPGHAERMRMLREAGFFRDEEILVPSGSVRPRDVTETLLFDAWQFEEGEPDLTVGRIEVEGRDNGERVRHIFNLLDYYNPDTETSSMARTTGYTCAAVVRLVASGLWTDAGVAPAEFVGRREDCFNFVLRHLAEREVSLFRSVETLD